jgi:hypothetical protein
MPIDLHLESIGQLATLGFIDVDAMTREVIPLSTDQIDAMRSQAHAIAIHFAPSSEAAT